MAVSGKMPVVSSTSPFPIVVLASGGGTNLQVILDQLHGQGEVEVVGVASDKPGAYALERATAAKVPTAVFPRDEFTDREARDSAMADWIESTGAELIALARKGIRELTELQRRTLGRNWPFA